MSCSSGPKLSREGVDVVGVDTRAGARLEETAQFVEFLINEMPSVLERCAVKLATADHLNKSGRGVVPSYEMSSVHDLGRRSTSQARLIPRDAVAACNGGVPGCGGLGAAGKGIEIHPDKSPALAVAGSPFKVVQQRPGVVASHPAAPADSLMHSLQMPAEEVHAGTVSGWLTAVGYVVRNAVFGDQDLRRGVVAPEPHEDVIEALRIDLLPAC
jgi:hypothetical protein